MQVSTTFKGATYLFPMQIKSMERWMKDFKPVITTEENETLQVLTLTIPDNAKPEDILEVGMLLQASIS